MSRRRMLGIAASGVLATQAGLLLSACGGSSGSGGAASDPSVAATTRTIDDIEAAARQEGGDLSYYTTGGSWLNPAISAFQKRYPFAKVNAYSGSTGDILAKVVAESNTGARTADAVQVNGGARQSYKAANILVDSFIPSQQQLGAQYHDPMYHAFYQVLQVLAYNKNLVATPPADPYDLADPSWKGKIVMDKPQNLGAAATFLASRRALWGDDKWMTWLDGLKANNVLLTADAGSAYDAVRVGERGIGPDSYADIATQPAGAPVVADFFPDTVVYPYWNCVTAKAQHPNSAVLWINYLQTEEGQNIIVESGRVPVMDLDVPVAVAKTVPAGTTLLDLTKLTDFWDHSDAYLKIFNKYWPA